ncbi:hypothetical protein [Sphingomonas sp. RS2018]
MTQLVSAIFDSNAEAQAAVADLRNEGVSDGALSVVTQQGGVASTVDGDGEAVGEEHGSVLRGILGGGALGAGLGIAALAIPGVGPLVAAGAIAAAAVPGAAVVGAAVGAAAGTLNETLVKHGVSEDDASYYGERLGGGGVLVTVDTGRDGVPAASVTDLLYRHGGHNTSKARVAAY